MSLGGHAPNQGFRRTVLMDTAVLFFIGFVGMIVIGVPGIKVMSVVPISFKSSVVSAGVIVIGGVEYYGCGCFVSKSL